MLLASRSFHTYLSSDPYTDIVLFANLQPVHWLPKRHTHQTALALGPALGAAPQMLGVLDLNPCLLVAGQASGHQL